MIKEFMSVMEDDVMVWFGLLITISAGFWLIKSLVAIPHWRLFQMEQLRLYFVEFSSGVTEALLSVDAVLLVSKYQQREAGPIYMFSTYHFVYLQASVCTVAVVLDGLLKARLQREALSTLVSWVLLWRTSYLRFGVALFGLFVGSLLCWLCHLGLC